MQNCYFFVLRVKRFLQLLSVQEYEESVIQFRELIDMSSLFYKFSDVSRTVERKGASYSHNRRKTYPKAGIILGIAFSDSTLINERDQLYILSQREEGSTYQPQSRLGTSIYRGFFCKDYYASGIRQQSLKLVRGVFQCPKSTSIGSLPKSCRH
jgi:hypothetical protein